jgi:hypothetical protein
MMHIGAHCAHSVRVTGALHMHIYPLGYVQYVHCAPRQTVLQRTEGTVTEKTLQAQRGGTP